MKFLYFFLILFTIFYLNSCAALFDNKIQEINIKTNLDNANIEFKDSLYSLPTKIQTNTYCESVKLTLIIDTIKRDYYLYDKRINQGFLEKIIDHDPEINYLNLFKGVRSKFPKKIFFEKTDTSLVSDFYKINDIEKVNYKTLNFYVGLPILNFFSINFLPESKENEIGLLGFSLGIEYFYGLNQALGIDVRYTINNKLPILSRNFSKNGIDVYSISLFNNTKYRMFDIRYGLNFNYNHLMKNQDQFLESKNQNISSIGAYLSLSANINSIIKTAITYMPSFYCFNNNIKFYKFNNIFSLEFQYQIKLFDLNR